MWEMHNVRNAVMWLAVLHNVRNAVMWLAVLHNVRNANCCISNVQ